MVGNPKDKIGLSRKSKKQVAAPKQEKYRKEDFKFFGGKTETTIVQIMEIENEAKKGIEVTASAPPNKAIDAAKIVIGTTGRFIFLHMNNERMLKRITNVL